MTGKQWGRGSVRLGVGVLLAVGTPLVRASEEGQAAADQVTEASYRYFLGDDEGVEGILYTHDGDDRGVDGPEHDLARDNIAAHFEAYGLTVTLEPVLYWSTTYYNVVGTKLGTTYPDGEYIIGAHYDSVSNPGADDNASGVALVLESARILTQYDSDYTIRFVAFTREEQGLYGSEAYVDDHAGDDILGMISADMVSYNTGPEDALIYGHAASDPWKSALAGALATYAPDILVSVQGGLDASDHAPFEAAGYPACLLIEGDVWSNPHYHKQTDSVDTPDYIDYAYAVKMTRAIVGLLADQAGVQVVIADGDHDGDEDVDFYDFNFLQRCFGGDGLLYPEGLGCESFDFDGDDDVDLTDYDEFYGLFTGHLFDDCNTNGFPDEEDIASGYSQDCNSNGVPDECDIADGTSEDCNSNGIPDECEPVTLLFVDDFETDLGWQVTSQSLENGEWERANPQQTEQSGAVAQPGDDYTETGTLCYVTAAPAGASVGAYDVDGGPTRVTSPLIDMSLGNVTLSYAYWFYNDDGDDTLEVEVSNNGGAAWVPLATHEASMSQWRVHDVRVDDVITPTASMRLRFSTADNPNDSITEALIDDVLVTGFDCGS